MLSETTFALGLIVLPVKVSPVETSATLLSLSTIIELELLLDLVELLFEELLDVVAELLALTVELFDDAETLALETAVDEVIAEDIDADVELLSLLEFPL
jgi:hypothetical protein